MYKYLILFVAAPCYAGCTTTELISTSAEKNAVSFFTKLHVRVDGVSCSGADSDRDGYVSCTGANPDGTLRAIECGYDSAVQIDAFVNRECRVAQPRTLGLE